MTLEAVTWQQMAQMSLFAGIGIEMQTERTDMWTQSGEGSLGPTGRSIDVYTVSCVKQRERGYRIARGTQLGAL